MKTYLLYALPLLLLFSFAFTTTGLLHEDCLPEYIPEEACYTWQMDASFNGYHKHYYRDSNEIESEGNYNQGIPSGYWKFYFLDGQVRMEGNYSNEQRNGYWKDYYDNGNLMAEGNFQNCIREGYWKFYHPNGQLESEGNYRNAFKSGDWKFYHPQSHQAETHHFNCR